MPEISDQGYEDYILKAYQLGVNDHDKASPRTPFDVMRQIGLHYAGSSYQRFRLFRHYVTGYGTKFGELNP